MPPLDHPIVMVLLVCLLIQVIAWYWQWKNSNADVVDMAWTLGMVVCPIIYLYTMPAAALNEWLVLFFPILWYSRLLVHLVIRFRPDHEDSRYVHLRKHWSQHTQTRFLLFFMAQAGLSVLFSLPAYWVLQAPALMMIQFIVAVGFGLMALLGVTIADRQLLLFKRTHPVTAVCDVGLWRYSRHPNYFFEWLHWLVYPMVLWGSEWFVWSLAMAALMLLFLLKLTGLPFAEQQALLKRGEAYRRYQARTSSFFLWRNRDA